MLVLQFAKEEEAVIEGGRIVVKVLEIRSNGTVKLGFKAARSIPIDRRCIAEAKARDGARE